jgi:hypothetical protein
MAAARTRTIGLLVALVMGSCQSESGRQIPDGGETRTAPEPSKNTPSMDANAEHLPPNSLKAPPPSASTQRAPHDELPPDARSRVISKRADELQLHGFEGNQLAEFIIKLKNAVQTNDRAGVARLVKYPLDVSMDGRLRTLRNSRELLDAYESVMTVRVRQEIDNATLCNVTAVRQAAGLGGDVVWIKNLSGLGIVTINVPGSDARPFVPGGCQGDAAIPGVGCIPECPTK